MDIPKEAKDMVGNSYLFSGNYLDKKDRKEQEHLIKNVKMTDTFVKDLENTVKHPCVSFLIDFKGQDKWTKPMPIRSINLKLNVV
jgi:hypothetical protein